LGTRGTGVADHVWSLEEVMLLVALAAYSFTSSVRADDPLLNRITPIQAVSKADIIYIGKVSSLDEGVDETSSITVSINVLKILRGSEPSLIAVRIDTDANRVKGGIMLKAGDSYIFFLIDERTDEKLFKVLPATDENISLVKKLISN